MSHRNFGWAIANQQVPQPKGIRSVGIAEGVLDLTST
jgi:hypothetical protein